MNELQIFENAEFGKVRTVSINNEPWFVGRDVAEILGYKNPNEAIQDHVDAEDKFLRSQHGSEMLKLFNSVKEIQAQLGRQDNWFINESGVYSLVFGSKLPTAKKFKRWVTSEVLPTLRKTGTYTTPSYQIEDPIERAQKWIEEYKERQTLLETAKKQEQIIGELKPKADYTDRILQSKSLVPVTAIAKDYGMSAQGFNKVLHDAHIIYKVGNQWVLYGKYQAKGYTSSETISITRTDGTPDIVMNTKWTQKGRLFLYNFLKGRNLVPVIERGETA